MSEHKILASQIAEDLSQVTRIHTEVQAQIEAVTERALASLHMGMTEFHLAHAAAGRAALYIINEASNEADLLRQLGHHLRNALQDTAITQEDADRVGGHLALAIKQRDAVDDIITEADRVLRHAREKRRVTGAGHYADCPRELGWGDCCRAEDDAYEYCAVEQGGYEYVGAEGRGIAEAETGGISLPPVWRNLPPLTRPSPDTGRAKEYRDAYDGIRGGSEGHHHHPRPQRGAGGGAR